MAAFLEFCYMAGRAYLTDTTLAHMDAARLQFHQHFAIFRASGVRHDGLSLPRRHSLDHCLKNTSAIARHLVDRARRSRKPNTSRLSRSPGGARTTMTPSDRCSLPICETRSSRLLGLTAALEALQLAMSGSDPESDNPFVDSEA